MCVCVWGGGLRWTLSSFVWMVCAVCPAPARAAQSRVPVTFSAALLPGSPRRPPRGLPSSRQNSQSDPLGTSAGSPCRTSLSSGSSTRGTQSESFLVTYSAVRQPVPITALTLAPLSLPRMRWSWPRRPPGPSPQLRGRAPSSPCRLPPPRARPPPPRPASVLS